MEKVKNLRVLKKTKTVLLSAFVLFVGCGDYNENVSTNVGSPASEPITTTTTTVANTDPAVTEVTDSKTEPQYQTELTEKTELYEPANTEISSIVDIGTEPALESTKTSVETKTLSTKTIISDEDELPVIGNDSKTKPIQTKKTEKQSSPVTTKTTIKVTTQKVTTKAPTTTKTVATTKASQTQAPQTQAPQTQAPQTQAPQTQAPVQNYSINDIFNNPLALDQIAGLLNKDLLYNTSTLLPYGETFGRKEADVALVILNSGSIDNFSKETLREVFSRYSENDLRNGVKFYYNICKMEMEKGTDIDYTKYTADPEIGNYLNQIDNSYRNGTFNDMIKNALVEGNISDKLLNNAGVIGLYSSYDINCNYINNDVVDNFYMNNLLDNLCNKIYGHSYTR